MPRSPERSTQASPPWPARRRRAPRCAIARIIAGDLDGAAVRFAALAELAADGADGAGAPAISTAAEAAAALPAAAALRAAACAANDGDASATLRALGSAGADGARGLGAAARSSAQLLLSLFAAERTQRLQALAVHARQLVGAGDDAGMDGAPVSAAVSASVAACAAREALRPCVADDVARAAATPDAPADAPSVDEQHERLAGGGGGGGGEAALALRLVERGEHAKAAERLRGAITHAVVALARGHDARALGPEGASDESNAARPADVPTKAELDADANVARGWRQVATLQRTLVGHPVELGALAPPFAADGRRPPLSAA